MTNIEAQDIIDNCNISNTGSGICGCVDDSLYSFIGRFLKIAAINIHEEGFEHFDRFKEWLSLCNDNEVLFYAIATICDLLELTEHGTSIRGAWITDKGLLVMEAIAVKEANHWE